MIHYTLADLPTSSAEYRDFNKSEQPAVYLGCKIKNKYDEERLVFNKALDVKNFHIEGNYLKVVPICYINDTLLDLLYKQLCIVDDSKLTNQIYEKILNGFNLSCSECFGTRSTGIYPINGSYCEQIPTETKRNTLEYYYKNFFDRSNECCSWQNFSYLSMFILINKS